jgi:YtkA-like
MNTPHRQSHRSMRRFARSIQPRHFVSTALLAAALAACATPPQGLDLSLRHRSAQGRYVVQMEPPAAAPAINQIHSWQIKLSSPDGAPVRNARIAVDGSMPQHGHGLPTRPQVTREVADGTYTMEGMKFSMTGWWEIKLAIQAAEGADTAVFNAVVGASGLTR